MSSDIVNHGRLEINGQFLTKSTTRDQAASLFAKLNALLELGLSCELETRTSATIHSYLWLLSDLVEQLEKVVGQ